MHLIIYFYEYNLKEISEFGPVHGKVLIFFSFTGTINKYFSENLQICLAYFRVTCAKLKHNFKM